MEYEKNATQLNSFLERITKKYKDKKIKSHSFDKCFWRKDNFNALQGIVEKVISPKRGKRMYRRQSVKIVVCLIKLRNKHSAIDSNIN